MDCIVHGVTKSQTRLSGLHFHMLVTILQARPQQYVNSELPDIQASFRKGRGTRDQIANICWIMEKSKRVPEKHLLLFY